MICTFQYQLNSKNKEDFTVSEGNVYKVKKFCKRIQEVL
ncbi:hypothetical protein D068_cds09910 [Bacillus atrophaeus UCMB-5137]|nr:hypothetical protein D068_cds09910 [Bacillus atrophaeus UCMB-5137]